MCWFRRGGGDLEELQKQLLKIRPSDFQIYAWQGNFLVQVYRHISLFLEQSIEHPEELNVEELVFLAGQAHDLLECCKKKSLLIKSLSLAKTATLGLSIMKNAINLLISFDSISRDKFLRSTRWETTWRMTLRALLDEYNGYELFLSSTMDQLTLIPYLESRCHDSGPGSIETKKKAGLLLQMLDRRVLEGDLIRSQLPPYCPKVSWEEVVEGGGLGQGSFGSVVEVTLYGEKFACKKTSHVRNFHEEAAIHFRLQHPNIVRAVCYVEYPETDQERLGLIMELMNPANLKDFLHKSNPAVDFKRVILAVDVIDQIADAMRYLHKKCIMHRDLKARNVLVDLKASTTNLSSGRLHVKLGDLGTARHVHEGSALLTDRIGTGYWRAPEVRQGQVYSLKADVYSFGMTCYEILTGRSPEQAPTVDNGTGVTVGRPVLPAIVPHKLAELIGECWDENPDKRPHFVKILWRTRDLKISLGNNTSRPGELEDNREACLVVNNTDKTISLHYRESDGTYGEIIALIKPGNHTYAMLNVLEGSYYRLLVLICEEDGRRYEPKPRIFLDSEVISNNNRITILKNEEGIYSMHGAKRDDPLEFFLADEFLYK